MNRNHWISIVTGTLAVLSLVLGLLAGYLTNIASATPPPAWLAPLAGSPWISLLVVAGILVVITIALQIVEQRRAQSGSQDTFVANKNSEIGNITNENAADNVSATANKRSKIGDIHITRKK